jgi:hypothetical protein
LPALRTFQSCAGVHETGEPDPFQHLLTNFWSYSRLAVAVGCSKELIAAIVKGRA